MSNSLGSQVYSLVEVQGHAKLEASDLKRAEQIWIKDI